MEGNIRVTGRIIKCMGRENSPGQMAEDTKANMKMTRSTDKVYSFGLTEESTKEVGKMVNKMGLVFILEVMAKDVKVNGKKEEESSGMLIVR